MTKPTAQTVKLSTISLLASAAFAVSTITVTGCEKTPIVKAPTEPETGGTCEEWCSHAADLHCEAAKNTAGGGSCAEVCHNLQNSGFAHWNLGCRKKAATCALAEECEKGQ